MKATMIRWSVSIVSAFTIVSVVVLFAAASQGYMS